MDFQGCLVTEGIQATQGLWANLGSLVLEGLKVRQEKQSLHQAYLD